MTALSEQNRPITMGDVRLAVGEGKLTPADVLAGCNAELRRRASIAARAEGAPQAQAVDAGVVEALRQVRAAILDPVNSQSIVCTVWMPGECPETVVDFIDAALNPAQPAGKEG